MKLQKSKNNTKYIINYVNYAYIYINYAYALSFA